MSCFGKVWSAIGQLEQDREFCRHGMAHLLDVARIACLMAAESDSPPDKEVILCCCAASRYRDGQSSTKPVKIMKKAGMPYQ